MAALSVFSGRFPGGGSRRARTGTFPVSPVSKHRMRIPKIVCLLIGLLLVSASGFPQSSDDALIRTTRDWLKNSSLGARDQLNLIMDDNCLITTPAGDVLPKERLIPDDVNVPVQKLPPMDLDEPTARVFGDTGIVMSRLKPSEGHAFNATFVFVKRQRAWKLVGIQLSPR